MVWVRSLRVKTWIAGDMVAVSRGSAAWMRSTVLMTLAPGCWKITRKTPRLPSAQPADRRSSGAATAEPMSRTRSAPPLR